MFPLFLLLCHAPYAGAQARPIPSGKGAAYARTDSLSRLMREGVTLGEVVVAGNGSAKERQMRSTLSTMGVERPYIDNYFGASLMQTLERLPGLRASKVGSGQSKPMIRGLGANRILVAENGIKHEGQSWGDDHGLEADQFAVDRIEIIKGPAALAYGSDAIGGVIHLHSDARPRKQFGGGAHLFFRSNNESVGTALQLAGRRKGFWYKANATLIDYADYQVPTDHIQYYSYAIRLKERRLRNTAGGEQDGSLLLGYEGERLNGYLRVANVHARSGFFANAHGLEVMLSDIDYDRSRRDVDLPCQDANHLTLSNHTEWRWRGGRLTGDLAFQGNRRSERSEPVSHGYMPIPPHTLERRFVKRTGTGLLRLYVHRGRHALQAGISGEYQHNRRGGWGFILPDFEQWVVGGYLSDRFVVNDRLILSGGIRYDRGGVRIHRYCDWYKTPQADGDSLFVERSAPLHRSFHSVTAAAGVNWDAGCWLFKANLGKSFRMPIAKELGMNGINYHIFRYEAGNSALQPESAYQLDGGVTYEQGAVTAGLSPYLNYFPNYIYLNPTAAYREGLQLCRYTQCRVLRWGFEAELTWRFLRRFTGRASGEYLYARQLSGEKRGYTLPFSPPWSARVEVRYELPEERGYAALEGVVAGSRREVVPPEAPTPGHGLLNAALGRSFRWGRHRLQLTLRGENLLGKRYYDPTSYYRLIDVPEPGRNFSAMLGWTF